jgi:membrane protein CcdC involved in cytochrome C biogenesis
MTEVGVVFRTRHMYEGHKTCEDAFCCQLLVTLILFLFIYLILKFVIDSMVCDEVTVCFFLTRYVDIVPLRMALYEPKRVW